MASAVEHAGRRERLRTLWQQRAQADLLVVTDLSNIRYLTGFSGSNAVLVLGRDGVDDLLGTDGRYRDQVAQEAPGLATVIDRSTLERWLNDGAHALRSLFSLAQQYRYSGATRDDFASKNAVARAALEKFGELPQDVLEGTRRSKFAPPIVRRGLQ